MIYAFGSNGAGQLGLGHTDDTSKPQLVELPQDTGPVKKIVAGGNHTLILLEDGTVFATGNNEDGRTGLEELAVITKPRAVSLRTSADVVRFYDVAATWSASYFVATDRRSIYVCGAGEHGQLGLGDGISMSQPQCIELPDTIKSISSCLSHVVIVLSTGQVWAWGKGRKGQLGEPKQDCWKPRRIVVPFITVKAVCGADFTCLVNAQGKIMMLGSDSRDRFGLRANAPSPMPWIDIVASWGSVLLLTESGVVAWGRDDRGQLPPVHLPPLESLTAGSEHWLALTTDGQVLTGGWGEHGNCGEPTDEFGVVKGRWNVVNVDKPIDRIFAGCATSFLVAG